MNTPLMELIEWMKFETLPLPIPDTLILAKATELLEEEKGVIEKSYAAGLCQNSFSGVSTSAKKMASDYYTKTFTNESK